jgi:hypothetical protein
MPRKLLLGSVVLVALTLMPSASATKPLREVHTQGEAMIRGQCAFPVLGRIDGREIITTFTDSDGNPVKGIVVFPGNKLTLTNLESHTSIRVLGTGSSQVRVNSDGSLTARATGHGIFFPNPLTGERGIWYLSGKGTAILDEHGTVTSNSLSGRLVDLCSRLT